nr:hypothetical protein [Waterburya agarophytonicola]
MHLPWAVPGGVRQSLSNEGKIKISDRISEAKIIILNALDKFKSLLTNYQTEAQTFGNFPSLFMGLVGQDGEWEHYGGKIRFVDSGGNIIADRPPRSHSLSRVYRRSRRTLVVLKVSLLSSFRISS